MYLDNFTTGCSMLSILSELLNRRGIETIHNKLCVFGCKNTTTKRKHKNHCQIRGRTWDLLHRSLTRYLWTTEHIDCSEAI